MLGVAQILIVEVTQGTGHGDLGPYIKVGENVLTALCAFAVLDRQGVAGVFFAQGILGIGTQRVGLVGGDAVHIQ